MKHPSYLLYPFFFSDNILPFSQKGLDFFFTGSNKTLDTRLIFLVRRYRVKDTGTIVREFYSCVNREKWKETLHDILWELDSHLRAEGIEAGKGNKIIRLSTGSGYDPQASETRQDPLFGK
jgi:hypothetical protein